MGKMRGLIPEGVLEGWVQSCWMQPLDPTYQTGTPNPQQLRMGSPSSSGELPLALEASTCREVIPCP